MATVVLVGNPNVGKSVMFNCLTGSYATVSNYPGTTVDILYGQANINGKAVDVIDTPGMYSFIPITEEEAVTRALLTQVKADVIIHVIDTKNISRMLPLTLQLMETGLPVILNLNIMDEAKRAGVVIDKKLLSEILGIPIVATSAVKKQGIENLKASIRAYHYKKPLMMAYSACIEESIQTICSKLTLSYGMPARAVALLLLSGDELVHRQVRQEPEYSVIAENIALLQKRQQAALSYIITGQRQTKAAHILQCVMAKSKQRRFDPGYLERYVREPLTGIPILCLVLYYGLYQIVGKFGAGTLVDFMDKKLFAGLLTPLVASYTAQYIKWEWLQSLIIGEYGIFTLGIRYAIVIVLPIAGTFFLVFALLEDSGYLPRLAMLVDGVFKKIGLNGRAVIPLTLGTGCGTMAIMVTRTLETRRERLLATFLLALSVPCSAQLGVILSLLAHNSRALMLWSVYIVLIFMIAGWLSARLLPGKRSSFYMELPPLRIPAFSNILTKAWTRIFWYFVEIFPVFLITSLFMWLLAYCGALQMIIGTMEPLMLNLGLPRQAAPAFIQGFFRRDYGAAGLYDLAEQGFLSDGQLLVAAVTLTLFVPCVAQLSIMIKERGLTVTLWMLAMIIALALGSGWLVNYLLVNAMVPL